MNNARITFFMASLSSHTIIAVRTPIGGQQDWSHCDQERLGLIKPKEKGFVNKYFRKQFTVYG
jgi:hypothetical protein